MIRPSEPDILTSHSLLRSNRACCTEQLSFEQAYTSDMNRGLAWLLAAVAGIAIGSGTFIWLIDDLPLAVMLALVYAVGTRLSVEYHSTLPGKIHRDSWRAPLLGGVFAGLMTLVALFGVNRPLPISFELRGVVLLLVFGSGYTGLLFGIAIAREQTAGDKSPRERRTTSETERGDLPDADMEGP